MTEDAYFDWLAAVAPGSRVVVKAPLGRTVRVVDRVTATTIKIDNLKFRRSDGVMVGAGNYLPTRLEPTAAQAEKGGE